MPNIKFYQLLSLLLLLWPSLSISKLELRSPLFSISIGNSGDLTEESSESISLTTEINTISETHYFISVTIENRSSETINLSPIILDVGYDMSAYEDPMGGYGSSIYAYKDFFSMNRGKAETPSSGDKINDWFGVYNRYSLEAIRPTHNWEIANNTLIKKKEVITASGSIQYSFDFVRFPRNKTMLTALNLDGILIRNSWDWFRWLCLTIWSLLELLFNGTGNWGVAIIFLAAIVKLLTIPITTISLEYQKKAKEQQLRLGPKLKKLKHDFSGIKLSEKIIALYEEERYDHIAPLKSLMGLIIQIPILIALFTLIGEMGELRNAQFLWIDDLSLSDRAFPLGINIPFFGAYLNVLPFLMAGVTILSTWNSNELTGTTTFSLFSVAIVFFIFFYSFPAALVLYWLASNSFQFLHQLVHLKRRKN